MKKLLLLLILSIGFTNYSFAGVEDISIKCKGEGISSIWVKGGLDTGNYTHKVLWTDDSNKQFRSKGNMYVIGESPKSIKLSFDNGFRNRNLLEDGVYELSGATASSYDFEKKLTLDGKKGRSYFSVNREDGQIWQVRFEIEADRPLTYDVMGHPRDDTSRIVRDLGTWWPDFDEGCKKFTQMF
jgi:hypothetical protein